MTGLFAGRKSSISRSLSSISRLEANLFKDPPPPPKKKKKKKKKNIKLNAN